VEDEAVVGSCPTAGWGGEEVFGGTVVGATALDFRLEPNPRPLRREFIELIRARRGGGVSEEGLRKSSQRGSVWN
jgi:hypothetical protein